MDEDGNASVRRHTAARATLSANHVSRMHCICIVPWPSVCKQTPSGPFFFPQFERNALGTPRVSKRPPRMVLNHMALCEADVDVLMFNQGSETSTGPIPTIGSAAGGRGTVMPGRVPSPSPPSGSNSPAHQPGRLFWFFARRERHDHIPSLAPPPPRRARNKPPPSLPPSASSSAPTPAAARPSAPRRRMALLVPALAILVALVRA